MRPTKYRNITELRPEELNEKILVLPRGKIDSFLEAGLLHQDGRQVYTTDGYKVFQEHIILPDGRTNYNTVKIQKVSLSDRSYLKSETRDMETSSQNEKM